MAVPPRRTLFDFFGTVPRQNATASAAPRKPASPPPTKKAATKKASAKKASTSKKASAEPVQQKRPAEDNEYSAPIIIPDSEDDETVFETPQPKRRKVDSLEPEARDFGQDSKGTGPATTPSAIQDQEDGDPEAFQDDGSDEVWQDEEEEEFEDLMAELERPIGEVAAAAATAQEPQAKAPSAKGKGKALPAEIKAGGVRRKKVSASRTPIVTRSKPWTLKEFLKKKSVGFGPAPGRLSLSDEQRKEAEETFDRGLINVINERCRQAALAGPDEGRHPITLGFRAWMETSSPREIFNVVREATTPERRIVLGGMFHEWTDFTDLPQPTDQELNSWLVYGDLVQLSEELQESLARTYSRSMYVGSRTAGAHAYFGGARVDTYVGGRAKFDQGKGVTATNLKSYHLQTALRKGAAMELRVLNTWDPTTTPLKHVLGAEGIFVDFLQSYSRERGREYSQVHSDHMLQASIDASPFQGWEPKWDGLNRASPFAQGIRNSSSVAQRFFEANGWNCLCCDNNFEDAPAKTFQLTSHLKRKDLPFAMCSKCLGRAQRKPGESITEIREAGKRNRAEQQMALVNPDFPTVESRVQQLKLQDDLCSACGEFDIDPDGRPVGSHAWHRYWRPSPAKLNAECRSTLVCQACEIDYQNVQKKQKKGQPLTADEEDAWLDKRRQIFTVNDFFLAIDEPRTTRVTEAIKVRARRFQVQAPLWIKLKGNGFRCFCCQKAKWTRDFPLQEGKLTLRPQSLSAEGIFENGPVCRQCAEGRLYGAQKDASAREWVRHRRNHENTLARFPLPPR